MHPATEHLEVLRLQVSFHLKPLQAGHFFVRQEVGHTLAPPTIYDFIWVNRSAVIYFDFYYMFFFHVRDAIHSIFIWEQDTPVDRYGRHRSFRFQIVHVEEKVRAFDDLVRPQGRFSQTHFHTRHVHRHGYFQQWQIIFHSGNGIRDSRPTGQFLIIHAVLRDEKAYLISFENFGILFHPANELDLRDYFLAFPVHGLFRQNIHQLVTSTHQAHGNLALISPNRGNASGIKFKLVTALEGHGFLIDSCQGFINQAYLVFVIGQFHRRRGSVYERSVDSCRNPKKKSHQPHFQTHAATNSTSFHTFMFLY